MLQQRGDYVRVELPPGLPHRQLPLTLPWSESAYLLGYYHTTIRYLLLEIFLPELLEIFAANCGQDLEVRYQRSVRVIVT